jgi:XTP/dITP diphosphohydrolase
MEKSSTNDSIKYSDMSTKSLLFATANAHKLDELRAILPQYEVLGLHDVELYEDIPETGDTLNENAYLKVKYLYDILGGVVMSEDTGLEVAALDGAPGVHTARYAGDQRDPIDNMNKLLGALSDQGDRSARFRTVIALMNENEVLYFEGIVNGKIAMNISGDEGFGYDPVFIPDGYEQTFAELPSSIKNNISHRARAVQKLIAFLGDDHIRV